MQAHEHHKYCVLLTMHPRVFLLMVKSIQRKFSCVQLLLYIDLNFCKQTNRLISKNNPFVSTHNSYAVKLTSPRFSSFKLLIVLS